MAETLGEWRGASAVDTNALEQVLLRVSEMVCALPQLREMDINPIIVDEAGAVAVDARMVVEGSSRVPGGAIDNYDHLAILPYPTRYEHEWPLAGGGSYTVRRCIRTMPTCCRNWCEASPESRHMRFASSFKEMPAAMLSRFTLIDYDREMALVAVHKSPDTGHVNGQERIVGVSRYVTNPTRRAVSSRSSSPTISRARDWAHG